MKADLKKQLPLTMLFTFQGKETKVEYTYPWLPTKCTTCAKWGHSSKACQVKKREETPHTQEVDTKVQMKIVVAWDHSLDMNQRS